jgi:hypothetical protein
MKEDQQKKLFPKLTEDFEQSSQGDATFHGVALASEWLATVVIWCQRLDTMFTGSILTMEPRYARGDNRRRIRI